MLIEEIVSVIDQIEKQKKIIAKACDELKEIQEQLEIELETFDQGLEDLENAIDLFSEYI